MGIYNGIHTTDDDQYYYCSDNDCACHGPSYHDASRVNYVERTGYYNFVESANLDGA